MTAMILASYHFYTNPNLFSVEDDVTTEQRQDDIAEVVGCLTGYRPTHVAVEVPQSDQALLDRQYAQYLKGQWALPPSERYQLGFWVAEAVGLCQIHAIDFQNESETLTIGDVFACARQYRPDLFALLNEGGEQRRQAMQTRIQNQSVREVLRWLNQPEELTAVMPFYMAMTQIRDADDRRVGLDWVATLQARNLAIYANLRDRMKPDDRWLVIYGADHAAPLLQLLRDSDRVDIVPATAYL